MMIRLRPFDSAQGRRFVLLGIALALVSSVAFAQAGSEAVPIGPGATYQDIYRPEGPWAIHIVQADLSQQFLEVHTLLGGGEMMSRRQLTGIVGTEHMEIGRAVAAVNGDFFSLASKSGLPLGLHVTDGELVTFPDQDRSVFYTASDGTMHIERLKANFWLRGPPAGPGQASAILLKFSAMNTPPQYAGMVLFTPRFGAQTQADMSTLQIALVGLTDRIHPNAEVNARIASIANAASQTIPPDGAVIAARGVSAYVLRKLKVGDEVTLSLKVEPTDASETPMLPGGQILQAISGGPRIMRDGAVSVEAGRERFAESFATMRHPRTGIGIRNGTLVMVTVDGRQPGYSEGMTLYEFAKLFADLGCNDAMNLDGGGSTTMVVRDRVVNSPSGGVQRAVVNALGLISVAPIGPPIQIAIEPREFSVLSGERVALHLTGLDQYYNPVPVKTDGVEWDVVSTLGAVSSGAVFTGATVKSPTMGLVMVKMGTMTASSIAHVTPGPARVVVTPSRVALNPGATQQFVMQAYDRDGDPLNVSPGRTTWRVESPETAGKINQSGLFTAPARNGQVAVLACIGGVCGQADAVVGQELAIVQSFEKEGKWIYHAEPASITGGLDWLEDELRPRNHALRLRYDFTQLTGTRAAYADLNVQLPESKAFSIYVRGDGQGTWLRARLRDGAGRVFSTDLAGAVNWAGSWRRLTSALPDDAEPPVTLESIYLVEIHDERKPAGAIWIDDIAAAELVAASP